MTITIELSDDTITKLADAINNQRATDKLYTLKELSEILNISLSTLYKKKLPYVTLGKNSKKLYNKYDVIDFIRR